MPKLRPTSFSQAFGDDAFETTRTSTAPTNTNHEDVTNPDHLIRDHRDYHKALQPHVLGVSPRQQGNGLLKYIRNVPTQLCQMVPDYIMNGTSCALFLSIKYHQLYPAYIHKRLGELGRAFKVRVLLVFVDVDDCANSLLQLNKLGVTQSLTVILAWSEQEAARYLETFKALDGKDATSIQKRASNNVVDQMADVLTTCKPMNKTDAATVWQHFGNLKGIAQASQDELALCPGLGKVKTQRLYAALHKPFSKRATRERQKKKEEEEEAEKARMEKQNQAAKGNNDENENGSGAGRGEILIS
jgi:DNA excision repair protein ERCC-1